MSIEETIITLVADTVRKTIAETGNGHRPVAMLTIPEAAAELKVDKSTVYGWIREGRIKAIDLADQVGQHNRSLRIHRDELDRFLRECPAAYEKP